jgi:5-aminopentanamidase
MSSSKPDLYLDPVPMDLVWGDPWANVKRMREEITQRLHHAAKHHPEIGSEDRIFVFPEMTLTGFDTAHAETVALDRNTEVVQSVHALARELKTAIVFGFPERGASKRPVNTLLFIDSSGEEVADYQKMHLYTGSLPGAPSEPEMFDGGKAGVIVEYHGWKIGLAICFDLRFPQLFHAYAEEGADLVLQIASWIPGPLKSYQFQTLSAAHAIMGQYYFLSVNRSGHDAAFTFEGEALVYSPKGERLSGEAPFRISEIALHEARTLAVRASDQESYPVVVVET